MNKFKVFFIWLFIFILGTPSFSVSAQVASPSEISTPLDLDDDFLLANDGIYLNAPNVVNTVDLSHVHLQLQYYDSSGKIHSTNSFLIDPQGNWSFFKPVDYVRPHYISIVLEKGSFPPLGKYNGKFSLRFNSGVSFSDNAPFVWSYKNINNADSLSSSFPVSNYVTDLDAYASISIDFNTSIQYFLVGFYISDLAFNDSGYCNGTVAAQFSRLPSSADTDTGVAGGDSVSDTDITENISNSVGNIANSVTDIDASIRDLIQTISYQLEALWNQFAAEFTNFFTAWQNHTDAIVSAIDNISTAAIDGIDNIIQAGHEDAADIQDNQDKNTDKITGGYDNSGMTSENDRLNDSLGSLESAEDQLFDNAKNHINDFEFVNPFEDFTAPLADLSYWLVGIYDGLGALNIPISFGFTLSIALLLIGWYRFKGGV